MIINYGHLQPIENVFYGGRTGSMEEQICALTEKSKMWWVLASSEKTFLSPLNISIDRDTHSCTCARAHTHSDFVK